MRMALISRALARHDPAAVYMLLREDLSEGVCGRVLLELIATVPDWPKAAKLDVANLLTRREMQVLHCAGLGMSARETAYELPLGLETVKTHRVHVLLKLDVHTMGEATHVARERGLIDN